MMFIFVGMRRFELPAPRPPDVYSNLAELHPDGTNIRAIFNSAFPEGGEFHLWLSN